MSLFPNLNRVKIKTESDDIGIDFAFDEVSGQHLFNSKKGGELEECTVFENLVQYISKVVKTEKGVYEVYVRDESENFGVSIYDYLGQKRNLNYALSELKREVTEQLEESDYIDSVTDYTTTREGNKVKIGFKVVVSESVRKANANGRQSSNGSVASGGIVIDCDGDLKEGVVSVTFAV